MFMPTRIQIRLLMYESTTVFEGELSNNEHMDSGVPQGTVIGPILFLCHK